MTVEGKGGEAVEGGGGGGGGGASPSLDVLVGLLNKFGF